MRSPVEKIQNALIDALRAGGLHAHYLIEPLPQDPQAVDFTNLNRAIWIEYHESKFESALALGRGTQSQRARFIAHLFLRVSDPSLRALDELYRVRQLIQGQDIEGTRLNVNAERLDDHQDGASIYQIDFETSRFSAVPLSRPRPE